MMCRKPQESPPPTAGQVALVLAGVALGGFVGGWGFVAVQGGGYHLGLRCAAGSMLATCFAGVVCMAMAWIISGRVEILALVMSGGALVCGVHAARDGAWMAAAVSLLVASVPCGMVIGVLSRLGYLTRRPPKDPPGEISGS